MQDNDQLSALVNNSRVMMLADRLAILLVICNARDEDNWNPWALESTYDSQGSMGESIRGMKDYEVALDIVRSWVKKSDENTKKVIDDD